MSETIQMPGAKVFKLLNQIKNFPYFLENLEKVEFAGNSLYKWHFKNRDEIDSDLAVIIKLKSIGKHKLLYTTEDGAGFKYAVAIEISPAQANRGTIVRMKTSYEGATGDFVSKIEKLFGKSADTITRKTLQRLKSFCETGHVPTIDGQSSGRDEDQSPDLKH